MKAVLYLFSILLVSQGVFPAKILLLPYQHKGHVHFFILAGQKLQNEGHQVLLMTLAYNRHLVEDSGIPYMLIDTPIPHVDQTDFADNMYFTSGFEYVRNFKAFIKYQSATALDFCHTVTGDSELMKELQKQNFDVAIVDGLDVVRCYYVIPYKLGIRYITLQPRHDPWAVGLPAMPSSEGAFMFNYLPPDPSFIQRLKNSAIFAFAYLFLSSTNGKEIQRMVPDSKTTTFSDLYRGSELILVNTENICFNTARITAPHVRFIGGMSTQNAKPLSQEFEEFVSSADHGIIVFSFGTLINRMPLEIIEKILKAFTDLRQRVVFRYNGDLQLQSNDNILISNWIPQNDLLGHAKTRLFIGHGGNNGQMEALYHGVPMIVMPFALDQAYNADRVVTKKFGLSVNPLNFTSEDLSVAINEVITNPIYANNIRRCSAISRSFPSAQESLAFWVNHVAEFEGGDHLKPNSVNMPIWKVFMLDVIVFCLAVCSVLCISVFALFRYMYKRCRENKEKKE